MDLSQLLVVVEYHVVAVRVVRQELYPAGFHFATSLNCVGLIKLSGFSP